MLLRFFPQRSVFKMDVALYAASFHTRAYRLSGPVSENSDVPSNGRKYFRKIAEHTTRIRAHVEKA